MDRETALQNYREAVSRKIAAFRSHMGDSVLNMPRIGRLW